MLIAASQSDKDATDEHVATVLKERFDTLEAWQSHATDWVNDHAPRESGRYLVQTVNVRGSVGLHV